MLTSPGKRLSQLARIGVWFRAVVPKESRERRGQFDATLLAVLVLAGVGWYLLHSSAGMFSRTARSSRQAVVGSTSPAELSQRLRHNARERSAELERAVREMTERIRAVARDAAIPAEIERMLGELDAAARQFDLNSLSALRTRTTNLLNQLNDAYEIRIVGGANETVAIERESSESLEGGATAYYVLVEALDSSGHILPQEIRGAGMERTERVTRWAERVPQEVYERIQTDRAGDGRLGNSLFAVKQRGQREAEIRLLDSDGRPVSRLDQLTTW